MPARNVEYMGKVAREAIDAGSKSEREAVVLTLRSGEHFVLRTPAGPAFGASGFDELVGSFIRVSGTAEGRTLIVRDGDRISGEEGTE